MTVLKDFSIPVTALIAILPFQCSSLTPELEMDGLAMKFNVPCSSGREDTVNMCDEYDRTWTGKHMPTRVIYSHVKKKAAIFRVYFSRAEKCQGMDSLFQWPGLVTSVVYDTKDEDGDHFVGASKSGKTNVSIQLYSNSKCIKWFQAVES